MVIILPFHLLETTLYSSWQSTLPGIRCQRTGQRTPTLLVLPLPGLRDFKTARNFQSTRLKAERPCRVEWWNLVRIIVVFVARPTNLPLTAPPTGTPPPTHKLHCLPPDPTATGLPL